MKKSILFLLGAVILTSGCATVGMSPSLTEEQKSQYKKIIFVSSVGDEIGFVKIGTTVFNNKFNRYSIQDLNVDRMIQESAGEYFRDKSTIEMALNNSLNDKIIELQNDKKSYKKILKILDDDLKKLHEDGYDALLWVMQDYTPYRDTSVGVRGAGLVMRSFLGLKDSSTYVIAKIKLIDLDDKNQVFAREYWRWQHIKLNEYYETLEEYEKDKQSEIRALIEHMSKVKFKDFLKKYNFLNKLINEII